MRLLWVILLGFYLQTSYAIQIYGHRGAAGIAPENTIPGYQIAMDIGVDVIDMDVGMTKDNVLVVTHDLSLNPALTQDKHGHFIQNDTQWIHSLDYKTLRQYDVGILNKQTAYAKNYPNRVPIPHTEIPTLQQVITFAEAKSHHQIFYQIELKTDPSLPHQTVSYQKMANALIQIIQKNHLEKRVEIQSFDWRSLQVIQKKMPLLKTAYLTDNNWFEKIQKTTPALAKKWHAGYDDKKFADYPTMIKVLGGHVWGPRYEDLSEADVIKAHQLGLKVVPWAVDLPDDMHKIIAFGVDGIITNRPDILKKLKSYS